MRSPKYMNIEKVCAGMPARSSMGLRSASWKEGNRAERAGMLMSATGFIELLVQYTRDLRRILYIKGMEFVRIRARAKKLQKKGDMLHPPQT
jgi:hypothetical protein